MSHAHVGDCHTLPYSLYWYRTGYWRRCEKLPEVEEVLTTEEAAVLLRVSTKTILGLASRGTLPGRQLSHAWRFLRSDPVAYVHDGRGQGAALS